MNTRIIVETKDEISRIKALQKEIGQLTEPRFPVTSPTRQFKIILFQFYFKNKPTLSEKLTPKRALTSIAQK